MRPNHVARIYVCAFALAYTRSSPEIDLRNMATAVAVYPDRLPAAMTPSAIAPRRDPGDISLALTHFFFFVLQKQSNRRHENDNLASMTNLKRGDL